MQVGRDLEVTAHQANTFAMQSYILSGSFLNAFKARVNRRLFGCYFPEASLVFLREGPCYLGNPGQVLGGWKRRGKGHCRHVSWLSGLSLPGQGEERLTTATHSHGCSQLALDPGWRSVTPRLLYL